MLFQINNENEHDTNANSGSAAASKKMTLPLENDLPNPNFVRLQDDDDDNQDLVKEGPDKLSFVNLEDVRKEEKPAPASFLKSILMDRMTRKRSFGEDETPYVVKKSSEEETVPKVPRSPKESQEDCNDILRRRLLGLKDPNYELMQRQQATQKPPQHNIGRLLSNIEVKETPAEEMKGVDHEEVVQTVEDSNKGAEDRVSFAEDNVVPPLAPDYSHTSVLKHLLHRYTGGEDDGDKSDDKLGA